MVGPTPHLVLTDGVIMNAKCIRLAGAAPYLGRRAVALDMNSEGMRMFESAMGGER
jgi:hypothetical protein